MLTLEDRVAALERRLSIWRWLTAALACALVIFFVEVGASAQFLAQWFDDGTGRLTTGDPNHLTGATVDVIGRENDSAGLSLIARDPRQESFLMMMAPNARTRYWTKQFSLSSMWDAQQADGTVSSIARMNATYALPSGQQFDTVHLADFGIGGLVFCPGDAQRWTYGARSADAPALHIACASVVIDPGVAYRIKGDVTIEGHILDAHGNVKVW